jgi:predicted exporter
MYLSELVFSGLLVGTMRTRKELHKRLKALQPVNPAHTWYHLVIWLASIRRTMWPSRVACVIRLAQGQ